MLLRALSEEDKDNEKIKILHICFKQKFPTLRDVRNSAHHIEDRSRGYGNNTNSKMELKPISNEAIEEKHGGVLATSVLNDNKRGYTISDGSYAECEISENTLQEMTNFATNH